jgi:hypothetical protein
MRLITPELFRDMMDITITTPLLCPGNFDRGGFWSRQAELERARRSRLVGLLTAEKNSAHVGMSSNQATIGSRGY